MSQIAAGRVASAATLRATETKNRARASLARVGPLLGEVVLPFTLVAYLAIAGGGYDVVIRSEVGIAVWWILLLGTLVGALPVARIGRAGWIGMGLLAALLAWTGLALLWTESAERTMVEFGRVAMLLGVFALALFASRPGSLNRVIWSVGAAIATVSVLALISRLQPELIPPRPGMELLSEAHRLSWPLDYWNGLAAFVAMGIPLVLHASAHARSVILQGLAASAIPAMATTAFFTLSRGGAGEIAIALIVLLLLYPRRLALLPTLALTGFGSAILIAGAAQRDALESGLIDTAAARAQGDELTWMVLVVCAGMGLCQVAISLARKHEFGPRIRVSRRASVAAVGAAAAAAIVLALIIGLPGELSARWGEFKQPTTDAEILGSADSGRLQSASGRGRYQYWQAAIDAAKSKPFTGIGPGTFEYWWTRNGDLHGFVRDAHSLFFESLGELGLVGLALVLALVLGFPLATGARAITRQPASRPGVAAVLAACAAFCVAAAIDWAWELTVLPAALFVLAAALARSSTSGWAEADHHPAKVRVMSAPLALAAIAIIAIPAATAGELRQSQVSARAGHLAPAFESARTASGLQPYAASPALQRALVLELQGNLSKALRAARDATVRERTNWRTWLVRAWLAAKANLPAEAVAAYREARELNPRSQILDERKAGR